MLKDVNGMVGDFMFSSDPLTFQFNSLTKVFSGIKNDEFLPNHIG